MHLVSLQPAGCNDSRQPTFDGVANQRNQVVLPGQVQAPAAPDEARRHAQLAAQEWGAPEVEELRVSEMIHWDDVCTYQMFSAFRQYCLH